MLSTRKILLGSLYVEKKLGNTSVTGSLLRDRVVCVGQSCSCQGSNLRCRFKQPEVLEALLTVFTGKGVWYRRIQGCVIRLFAYKPAAN